MSHLTASEDPHDDASARQLAAFSALRDICPGIPASLGNSGGTLLGGDYRFDMTRPGIALYGLHPAGIDADAAQAEEAARLTPAVTWQARLLQHRMAVAGDTVGYNGTYVLDRESRIATIGVGYADGYPRSLGNRAKVEIAGHLVPVVGRVSMDSITVDVTDIDAGVVDAAGHASLLGPAYGLAGWRMMRAPSAMRSLPSSDSGRNGASRVVKRGKPGHKLTRVPRGTGAARDQE